jgi:hypothetical protein
MASVGSRRHRHTTAERDEVLRPPQREPAVATAVSLARTLPQRMTAPSVLHLQRTAGNTAVAQLLRPALAVQRNPPGTAVAAPVAPWAQLEAIDKEVQPRRWADKLAELLASGAVTIGQNPPEALNGQHKTIEVRCYVKAGDRALAGSSFVIHYHPGAGTAKVGSAYASQMHLKGTKHSKEHVYTESIPAAIKSLVPKYGDIKRTFPPPSTDTRRR